MMKAQGISLMTLTTDTHLGQEGTKKVSKYLQQEGMMGGGIAAKREIGEARGNTQRTKESGHILYMGPNAVYEGRVARATVNALDSGKELEVYGIYMPVRNNDGGRAEAIWERVMEDITDRGNKNFVINGDFNAETEAWIKNNGRTQLEEDVIYQGAIDDLNLIASIAEDYTFERARTQVDNILIPIELLHTLQTAHTATGVREKDHRTVVARLAWVQCVLQVGTRRCNVCPVTVSATSNEYSYHILLNIASPLIECCD
eukprot:3775440-Pleurochrysis_carterae.AAC.1